LLIVSENKPFFVFVVLEGAPLVWLLRQLYSPVGDPFFEKVALVLGAGASLIWPIPTAGRRWTGGAFDHIVHVSSWLRS
jgi:hypothetical protein